MTTLDTALVSSSTTPRTGQLIKNGGFILASQLWFPLLSLVATPYIVHAMGVQRYGVFTLLSVFGGYLSYLDLGFGWAIIKFVAEQETKRDQEKLRRIIATGLLTTIAGGCIGGLLLVAFSRQIATGLLNLPPELIGDATYGLALSGLGFALNLPLGTLNGVLKGIQRFDITSAIQVVFGTATIVGTIAVLYAGYGLLGAVAFGTAMGAASLAVHIAILYRVRPALCVMPRFHKDEFRQMFDFSAFSTVSRVGMTAIMQLDKFFVALFLPVAAVSYYAIAFTVAQKLNMIASNAATVLFPVASGQFAADGLRNYRVLHSRVAELVFLLTLVPASVLAIFATDVRHAWMGASFAENSATPLIVLAAGFAAVSAASVDAISIEGAGRPRVTAAFLAVSGAVSIVLCPILTRAYGISGTAAAVAMSLTLFSVLSIRFFNHNMMGATLAATLGGIYLRPGLVAAVACASAFMLLQLQLTSLTSLLVVMATVTAVACGVGVWIIMSRSERQAVMALVLNRVQTQ